MLSEFTIYLRLGFRHIADFAGYDHVLFIVALGLGYTVGEWRRLAILVTAFTVGHSITLALATLRLISVPSSLVEALIPATIVATALLAIVQQQRATRTTLAEAGAVRLSHSPSRYLLAACFGLIHGLGFSTYLRTLLGGEESIALPLLAFNVGLELGQLLTLAAALTMSVLAIRWLRLAERDWVHVMAGATGGVALILLMERL